MRSLRHSLPLVIFVFVLIFAVGVNASIETMAFNSLENPNSLRNQISDPYQEGGFQVSNENKLFSAGQGNNEYAGSAGLHERNSKGLLTLSQINTNSFALISIDLSILDPSGVSPPVTFTGYLTGGGTTSQAFTPTTFGFVTFAFNTAFNDVTSVEWRQGINFINAHQFDNIVLNSQAGTVPEPTTLTLAAFGLLGMSFRLRSQRSS